MSLGWNKEDDGPDDSPVHIGSEDYAMSPALALAPKLTGQAPTTQSRVLYSNLERPRKRKKFSSSSKGSQIDVAGGGGII